VNQLIPVFPGAGIHPGMAAVLADDAPALQPIEQNRAGYITGEQYIAAAAQQHVRVRVEPWQGQQVLLLLQRDHQPGAGFDPKTVQSLQGRVFSDFH